MTQSIFLELTEMKGQPSNFMFERTHDARILQISADGSYLDPMLDPIVLVDLQAALTLKAEKWYFIKNIQAKEQDDAFGLDKIELVAAEEGQVLEMKGYRFIIRMNYRTVGSGVTDAEFQESLSVVTKELAADAIVPFYGNLSLEESVSVEGQADEDILVQLEKEYFAVLQTPELLHYTEHKSLRLARHTHTSTEDLLSQGESLKEVPLLDMVEGAMSIADVEKSLSEMESDFFKFETTIDDVLALYGTEESAPHSHWVAPAVSQKNHRHHSINAPMNIQVSSIDSGEKNEP